MGRGSSKPLQNGFVNGLNRLKQAERSRRSPRAARFFSTPTPGTLRACRSARSRAALLCRLVSHAGAGAYSLYGI